MRNPVPVLLQFRVPLTQHLDLLFDPFLHTLAPLEAHFLGESHAWLDFDDLARLEGPLVIVLVDQDSALRRVP